jgi:hypothetical protein
MLVGTQVGAYRVLQEIGKGGMGAVWLAEQRQGRSSGVSAAAAGAGWRALTAPGCPEAR